MTFVPSKTAVWPYILKTLKPFPGGVMTMILVAVLSAISLSLKPYLIKCILDSLNAGFEGDIFSALFGPIIAYLGLLLIITTSFRCYDYFVQIKMIPHLRAHLDQDCLRRLMNQSHTYYQNNFSGTLANKVNDLAKSVPEIVQTVMDTFLADGLCIGVAIFTLWQTNPLFGICMLLWTSLFIGFAFLYSKRLSFLSERWAECGSMIVGRIVDVLSNMMSVRLFANALGEKHHLEDTLQKSVHAEQSLEWAYFWMWLCYGLSAFLLQALNFYFLCQGYTEGWVTIGDFALVLVINLSIVDLLWKIAQEFSRFSKQYGRISQSLEAILEIPDLQDQPDALLLKVGPGQIVFENVTFDYTGGEPLFQNKSLTIDPGQKVGLVGYSGAGKTSFAHLILRLYDVNAGQILIDGQAIASVTQDSLRRAIGMIPQDPSLFHRSLMENIRYGQIDASDGDVIEAAKRAHAHDFITTLPEGYDSLVGERGVKLSGGQRQRIAIARAILKDPPILILDEATSQLDSLTEADIQESLWDLMQGKTAIVIAHRLSTLLHMDRILVFEGGVIVQDGPHRDLLHTPGLYRTLWNSQVGGFLPDHQEGLSYD